jgi:hypothetical protein
MNVIDFAWLSDNSAELCRKYAGKWIAVHDGEVIGVGDTATEAAAQADKRQPDGDYILEALDLKGDVIYAGS